jgi:hypothetical protein
MALDEFTSALERTNEVELGTVGRVSKRQTSRPVWFVREQDRLFLMPITGSHSQWYRNVVSEPTVHLTAAGAEYRTRAMPVSDPGRVRHVLDEFRAKYGAEDVAQYYTHPDVAVEVPLG